MAHDTTETFDTVTYETRRADGCVLAHTVDVGREWLALSGRDALDSVREQMLEWRRLALHWHDHEAHTVDHIAVGGTLAPYPEANRADTAPPVQDERARETTLSTTNVGGLRTHERDAYIDDSSGAHEWADQHTTLGAAYEGLGTIDSHPDANNPHLWLDTLRCTHGVSNVTRLAHDPLDVVENWMGAAAIHGMTYGCTCLLDYVRSYRRMYFA